MKVFYKMAFVMLVLTLGLMVAAPAFASQTTANGWYEGQEIYYIDHGPEKVTERAHNQIYLIGGDREFQGNVVLCIPGDNCYTSHWNVNIVHTAPGKTVQDIVNAGLSSSKFIPGATMEDIPLFDDVAQIEVAENMGLVVIEHPGIVVHCPIVSEVAAEDSANQPKPEIFTTPNLSDTF